MSDINPSAPNDSVPSDIPVPDPAPTEPVEASVDPTSEAPAVEVTPDPIEESLPTESAEQPVSESGENENSSSTESVDTDGTSEFTSEQVPSDPARSEAPTEIDPILTDAIPVQDVPLPDGVTGSIVVPEPSLSDEDIEERFGFHKATIEGPEASAAKHSGLRTAFKEFAGYLAQVLPYSRESSLTFTALEEASMWSHKAIAKSDPLEGEPVYVVAGQDAERILTNVAALRAKGLQDDIMQNLLVELGLS